MTCLYDIVCEVNYLLHADSPPPPPEIINFENSPASLPPPLPWRLNSGPLAVISYTACPIEESEQSVNLG